MYINKINNNILNRVFINITRVKLLFMISVSGGFSKVRLI
jgi:hypothetical protein